MKKLLCVLCLCIIASLCFGCQKDEKTKIGILQYISVEALDKARIGFIEALKEKGFEDGKNITIQVINSEGDDSTVGTDAATLVRSCDLVLGIATPAAVALQTACQKEGKDIPILFTAVTDPVSASLVKNPEAPEANITGTSDMNPVSDQVDLILELVPSIKKLGVLYTVTEVNSKVQSDLVEAECKKKNVEFSVKTIADINEISTVVNQMISDGIQALYIPTDNILAKNLQAVATVTDEKKIPMVVGESGMISDGGTITYSISYDALGKLTGEMAAKILSGAKVKDVPVSTVDVNGLEIVINQQKLKDLGIELPESIKNRMK